MSPEFMSSEESDPDEVREKGVKRRKRIVRPLRNQSKYLTHIKAYLDKQYLKKVATRQALHQLAELKRSDQPSDRKVPAQPRWASADSEEGVEFS